MEFVTAYNAFTKDDADEKAADRIYVIARENGKQAG